MPKRRKNKLKTRTKVNGQELIQERHSSSPSVDMTENTSVGSFNSADENSDSMPQCVADCRDRSFIVGYVTPLDSQQRTGNAADDFIYSACETAGETGFNFLCYPLAGVSRANQYSSSDFLPSEDGTKKLVSDLPPVHVNLSDVQLGRARLSNFINGFISPWIDCDHPNVDFAKYSMKQLDSCELPNAEYLGMRTVVIEVKRRENPNLIRILRKWMWQKDSTLCFWIIYPSAIGQIEGTTEGDEIWTLWADFREQLFNYSRDKLIVGIKFGSQVDKEFIDLSSFRRWRGEPLDIFWFDLDVLPAFDEFSAHRMPGMSPAYSPFFKNNFYTYNQRCMISSKSNDMKSMEHCSRLLKIIRISIGQILKNTDAPLGLSICLDELGVPFNEQFQLPLQPNEDNLSHAVYSTFERHVQKYEMYGKAILHAVTDLFESGVCSSSKSPVIFVVGAGRGGLIERVFEAESKLNEIRAASKPKKWIILAIEKNPFAALSLEAMNRKFNSRIRVIKADARDFNTLQALIKDKADLIVSEMLGSFGCNELEPEVLGFIEKLFTHEKTIMIPQFYANFVEPIHSLRMLQAVKSRQLGYYERLYKQKAKDPDFDLLCPSDKLYVVPLNHIHRLMDNRQGIQQCFAFVHPSVDQNFTRSAELLFDIKTTCDVTGFAGYFEVILYKSHSFSTIPGSQKDASLSWFPAYLPVRKTIRCPAGSTLKFKIIRCADESGVWYERQQSVSLDNNVIFVSDVQNANGAYNFMRLAPQQDVDNYDDKVFEAIDKKFKIVL